MTYTTDELQLLIEKVRRQEVRWQVPATTNTFIQFLLEILIESRNEKRDIDIESIHELRAKGRGHVLGVDCYFDVTERVLELMYDTPFEELPLKMTAKGLLYREVVNWRLEIGK